MEKELEKLKKENKELKLECHFKDEIINYLKEWRESDRKEIIWQNELIIKLLEIQELDRKIIASKKK